MSSREARRNPHLPLNFHQLHYYYMFFSPTVSDGTRPETHAGCDVEQLVKETASVNHTFPPTQSVASKQIHLETATTAYDLNWLHTCTDMLCRLFFWRSRFKYRKEHHSHKSGPYVMHVFEWEGKSSTRLEECTRELQGIVLGSEYSDSWDGSLQPPALLF